jgi:hypothetical protein
VLVARTESRKGVTCSEFLFRQQTPQGHRENNHFEDRLDFARESKTAATETPIIARFVNRWVRVGKVARRATGPRRPCVRRVPRRGSTAGYGPCWGMREIVLRPRRESQSRRSHSDSARFQGWSVLFHAYLKSLQIRLRESAVRNSTSPSNVP